MKTSSKSFLPASINQRAGIAQKSIAIEPASLDTSYIDDHLNEEDMVKLGGPKIQQNHKAHGNGNHILNLNSTNIVKKEDLRAKQ